MPNRLVFRDNLRTIYELDWDGQDGVGEKEGHEVDRGGAAEGAVSVSGVRIKRRGEDMADQVELQFKVGAEGGLVLGMSTGEAVVRSV